MAAVHPEERAAVKVVIEVAIREPGKLFEKDYRLMQADGSIRWVTARGRVECDTEGKARQFPGVIIDITERKHAKEGFRKLAETLEAQVQTRTQELQARNTEVPAAVGTAS